MKYTLFFGIVAIYLLFIMATTRAPLGTALAWPIASAILMAMAYLFNKPSLVLGKDEKGRVNPALLLVNLPWLVLTWAVFFVHNAVSKESPLNRIGTSNLYIGRYPLGVSLDSFSVVLDLTAEFPRLHRGDFRYRCIPNLDGVPLSSTAVPDIDPSDKVLVHCAQGHGRSATLASMMLAELDESVSRDQALEIIQSSRPHAKPSRLQVQQLMAHQGDRPEAKTDASDP